MIRCGRGLKMQKKHTASCSSQLARIAHTAFATFAVVAMALIVTSFAAAGGQTEVTKPAVPSGPVTLTWWGDSDFEDANMQIADGFNNANQNITIKYQGFPYDAYIPKLQAAFAARQAPDAAQVFGSWMPNYEKNGLLAAIPNAQEYQNRFYAPTTAGYTYKGVLYGLPHEFNIENGGVLTYPAMFKAKGLAYPPKSWDEIVKDGQALTVMSGNLFKVRGFDFINTDSVMFLFLANILQQGATYWTSDGHVNFTSPQAVKAMQFEVDLINKYHLTDLSEVANTDIDSSDTFFKGGAAMSMRGPWVIAVGQQQYKLTDFGYAPLPSFVPGNPPSFAAESGWGEVVATQTKYKEAAWKFLDYMMSKPIEEQFNLATYTVPADKAIAQDPAFAEKVPLMKTSLNMLQYGRPLGLVWDRDFLSNAIYEGYQTMVAKKETVEEGLKKIQDSVNTMIDQHTN